MTGSVVMAVTSSIVHYRMFTWFMVYEHEGYMLLFLKSFLYLMRRFT